MRFSVEIAPGRFAPEPDPGSVAALGTSYRRLRGRLEIKGSRLPLVAPEDELVPLVTNLCFRAVVELRHQPHVVVGYTDTYGYLRLDREGETLRLSGDGVADVRVAARTLVDSLVACGARFRTWLPRCDLTGDVAPITAALGLEEQRARTALRDWDTRAG